MRLTFSMIGLVGAVAALSACGGGGERAALIAKAETDCVASLPNAPPGVNPQRLCSCLVNAVSEGKSESEMRDLFKSKGPPPGAQEAMMQCATAEMKAAGK